ncbi:uncharacterized protein yc1106_01843 [Curvularia clavata]|uniref:Uncharacterized protein n=1 Tax=Curvularia clavata TaxID=95742 RepID=A0A9Q8Z494_CURCL|nr:uncharacterized protein yc1106_01843 [Curvularia clavata]
MATMSDPSTYFKVLVSPQIPSELVLHTIQYLPFNKGALISALRSAHPRLRALISTYEQSLTGHFMLKELRHAATDFPCKCGRNFDWLADCVRSYDVLDDILDSLCSEYNFWAISPHNASLANAGLLLLFRISSLEKHKDKLSYISSLQRDPLIAIYLVLHHATLSARYNGEGWISQDTYGQFMDGDQLELRNELEFCFAEAALSIGPSFISDTLLHYDGPESETTLLNFYHEHGTHDWEWPQEHGKGEFEPPRTQGPRRNESEMERSLFTVLLEHLAELMQCELRDVRARVEQDLESAHHPLAYLSLGGKERLLEGKNL